MVRDIDTRRVGAGDASCKEIQRQSVKAYVLALLLLRQRRFGVADLDATCAPNARIAIVTPADVSVTVGLRVKVDFARGGVKGVPFTVDGML
jgi:hypothetical protein